MSEETPLADASKSLRRIQEFDANSLVRKDDLGVAFEFSGAVDSAKKLIALFQKLPVESLEYYPEQQLGQIQSQSDSVFNSFNDILSFNPEEADASNRREGLITELANQYQPAFTKLQPHISFSVARTANFHEISERGRATVQGIQDNVADLLEEIEGTKAESSKILEEVRQAAAERGVSQEAYHFSKQAEWHKEEGDRWQWKTVWMAVALGAYSALTLVFHKIDFLKADTIPESIQFTVSKVLVFGVLAYMLGLCAKNFLSHRHNQIVNEHRQNSLMTFQSLVNAGSMPESRDIVLQQAAAAIYRLHDTGYVKTETTKNASVMELLPRTSLPLSGGTGDG